MRMYQMYVCSYCGRESQDGDEIESCEARHFGLTVKEKHEWDVLKANAKYCGSVVYDTNNEETRKAYDDAIHKLCEFEQLHKLGR